MRAANLLVLDENLQTGSSPAHTSDTLSVTLGSFDQLAIMAVVDDVVGGGDGFKVVVEHSADGRTWLPKSRSASEIGGGKPTLTNPLINLQGGGQTAHFGYDAGSVPSLGLVRLKVDLGSTTSAHVRVYVTGRNLGGAGG
jgi:hypothetical protein